MSAGTHFIDFLETKETKGGQYYLFPDESEFYISVTGKKKVNKKRMTPLTGKKILITGGNGLVGTNLVIALAAKKARILASFHSRKPRILKQYYKKFDFTRREDCLSATRNKDLVFLCAAVTGGIQSKQKNPLNDNLINLKIQCGLLEACRQNKVKKVILISSSTVYQPAHHPVREDELDLSRQPPACYLAVGGLNRYVEQLAAVYVKKFNMNIAVVRPTNLYGPFDHFEENRSHVLPALIKRALIKEDPFVVWGRPDVVRDFLYIDDFIDDLLNIARRTIDSGPLNVAHGRATRIEEAVKIVLKECNHHPKVAYDRTQPTAAAYRMVSIKKFESIFGKRKRTPLPEGVRKTIQWYQNTLKNKGDVMAKKKMLICGATGFIGRNMAEYFSKQTSFEIYGTFHGSKPYDYPGIQLIKTDLRDAADVNRVIEGMDVVIQAAATTSGAKDTVYKPYYHVTDNAVMSSLIYRAAHEQKVSHVIFFSCTTMYPSSDKPLKENDFDANKGIAPSYFGVGWTKVYLEKMCEFYARLGQTKFTAIRHSNIYGPYDKYDLERSHVFGATVTKVMTATNGGSITVWGSGEEARDLLYVSDLVDFVERVLEKQITPFELVNLGCGYAVSINEIVSKIIRHAGKNVSVKHDTSKPTIKTSLCVDTTKAKELFDWNSKISLDEGILKTLEWYKKNIR